MIAIIDYGMGNLRSVQKAFEKVGAEALITQNPADIQNAQKVVLPGVGAMQPAMQKLTSLGMVPVIKSVIAAGKPFLGICLGLQLLFTKSDEGGAVSGLGVLPGSVKLLTQLKVPHMGWNQLAFAKKRCALFSRIPDAANVYFCHSYCVQPDDAAIIAATTDYGMPFVSAVWSRNVFGVQFHPEKSQSVGLEMLKNFKEVF